MQSFIVPTNLKRATVFSKAKSKSWRINYSRLEHSLVNWGCQTLIGNVFQTHNSIRFLSVKVLSFFFYAAESEVEKIFSWNIGVSKVYLVLNVEAAVRTSLAIALAPNARQVPIASTVIVYTI